MSATTIVSVEQLRSRVGSEIALSEWIEVTQARIDQFADATGDRQWIHVDPERAARESPYGRTVAHGFLTLSLLALLYQETITVTGLRIGINYGFNRVRFTGPVPSGARIRARFRLAALEDIPNGVQMTWDVKVECEGAERPVLVAEWLNRRQN
ncbi:MAG: MaoC family dehydratase [Burkholderiales bacterium]|nr:MaoC family dehydratase [Burkholderiales bacterium]